MGFISRGASAFPKCYNGDMQVSLTGLHAEARCLLETLIPKENEAVIVGLSGELGAGKTTFVKEIADLLGIEEIVTSPTFVIQKVYKLKNQKFSRLIHIDAYRLGGGGGLQVLGFEELLKDPKNLIFVEWPEKVKDILPNSTQIISFSVLDGERRELSYA
ncbi:MAG: tRNA (adenosine(37)-N6)-threonylcarbamoyltransferase complex ATPase subunit type 1 TsaE [Candidatus Paceibacterota bacterium]